MKAKKVICKWCGAEIKISKKGNPYCSNICWEKEPYKSLMAEEDAAYACQHEDWGDR